MGVGGLGLGLERGPLVLLGSHVVEAPVIVHVLDVHHPLVLQKVQHVSQLLLLSGAQVGHGPSTKKP